ncbi:hypothetical protein A3C87_01195 [Candidatus Kaiserbacteria bacterium RIFCSPHIGHO2_02_FULL_49_34]|uniref:STAS domain-containing protein n=1 Tax=Candidatus Kaiserbacteria bacterium RIFCSPHIGHO2_02_FULL_49_34 TaxID=1798491 RepID=A0A1F6DL84_9BACT|nr:MAG: hypothetical protein A3C87_01195 [Candidatus Kaiserbacteria bacterium RIFCSPHIGHO2_02_FULL_49_34]
MHTFINHLKTNWQAGLTVALISVPLSLALSIASGAGPMPGIITGVWATLIASVFASSNYNIIGPAGALATVLFAATIAPQFGVGAAILPLIAIGVGIAIFVVFALKADRFLYYVPASIIHGFSAGVAVLIASSQLFDGAGLALKRTGHFIGDLELFGAHIRDVNPYAVGTFVIFLTFILLWKRYIKSIPAVIPAALLGMGFGYIATLTQLPVTTLLEKFGTLSGTLYLGFDMSALTAIMSSHASIIAYIKVVLLVAAIAILETLITAKVGDKMTRTQCSPRKELFGLALANIGSGFMGGLPATGVFLRTGANIKAGATHRTAAGVSAVATALIAVVALPFFVYLPAAVIAAMLINTAIGLIEMGTFKEYWKRDKQSFGIAILVAVITIVEDPGLAVLAGVMVALLVYVDRVSRGHSRLTYNFKDGTTKEVVVAKGIAVPEKPVDLAVYSIAGTVSYISAPQHSTNLRKLMRTEHVRAIAVRLRDCYALDLDAVEMLEEIAHEARLAHKKIYFTSVNDEVRAELMKFPTLALLLNKETSFTKTSDLVQSLKTRTI